MPIYEFKCNKCGNNFETLVLGSDTPECPSCSSTNLLKMISKCGFVTKASNVGDSAQAGASTTSSSACSGCSATSCATCGSR